MEFSQYRYLSIVAFCSTSRSDVTIRSKRLKDASFQLGFHLAKHSTPTYGVKTEENNFLRSGRDNNIRRAWDVTGQRCFLEQLSIHNLLNTGSFMTFEAIQKASNFLLLDSDFPLAP